MAKKELILSLKIEGTKEEQRNLKELEKGLRKLKERRTEINRQLKNNIPLSSKMRKEQRTLSTRIKATTASVNKLNRSILVNNGVLKKSTGLSAGIAKGFRTMALQIGGAVAAFALLKNTFNIIKDFQQANADLAAVLGKTRSEITALTDNSERLGRTTKFTATQISGLAKEFAKLGFSSREILNATEATLSLAAATGTDLARAAEVVGATIRGFGLDASETQRVVDVMAKSFSKSALDMEKFSLAMGKVAPVARAVGLTIEEVTGLMGALADSGIEASTIGTSLRKIFIELARKGLTLEDALAEINASQDKLTKSTELFGIRAATAGLVLAENTERAAALTIALNNAGGAAEKMAKEQLDTLEGKLTILNSAWQGFIISLLRGDGVFGEIAGSIIELTTGFLNLGGNISKAEQEMTRIEKASSDFNNVLKEEEERLKDVFKILKDENTSKEFKRSLTEELNTVYGEYLTNLIDENSSLTDIQKAQSEINNNLRERIALQLGQAEVVEIVKEFREEEEKLREILRDAGLSEAQIRTFQDGAESLEELSAAYTDVTVDFLVVNGELISISDTVNKLTFLQNDQKKAVRDIIEAYKDLIPEINTLNFEIDEENDGTGKGNKQKKEKFGLIEKVDEALKEANKRQREAITKEDIDEATEDIELLKERKKLLLEITKITKGLQLIKEEDPTLDINAAISEEEAIHAELRKEEIQNAIDLTQQFGAISLDIMNRLNNRQSRLLNNRQKKEISALEEKRDKGILTEEQFNDARKSLEIGFDKERSKILSRQAKIDKTAALFQIGIRTAVAIMKAAPNPAGMIAAGIVGAVNAGIVAATPIPEFAQGGLLKGKSHAQGGIPTADGQMEFEGGEAVINKRSTAMFRSELSAMNVAGGGIAFNRGGIPVHKFQAGDITPPITFGGRTTTEGQSLDIDAMAERMGEVISENISSLNVINVVSDTTSGQISIINTESEATFG